MIELARRSRDAMREAPLRVLVPEWVAHSRYGRDFRADVQAGRGPQEVMPRFLRWTERETPAALQGERRFARAPAPCRCVVPGTLPNRLQAMRQGAQSC